MWLLSLLLSLTWTADTTDDRRADVYRAISAYADPLGLRWDSTAVAVGWVDLTRDGREDALVYVRGTEWCGSGGCTVLVFERLDERDAVEFGPYRIAAEISLAHGPIVVSESGGYWADLVMADEGGDLRVLRFDGETYPSSPAGGDRLVGVKPTGTVVFATGQ